MGCLGAFVGVAIVLAMAGFGYTELVATLEHGDAPVFPMLLLVIPLLAAGAIVAAIVSNVLLRGRATTGLVRVTTVLAAVAIGAGMFFAVNANVVVRRPSAALTAALAPACARQAVPGASVVSTSGNHLVVLDISGKEQGWTGFPPVAWRPPNLGDAELVACVGEETTDVIEVCPYTGGPSITRYEARRTVTVVEARTGSIVATFTVSAEPRNCMMSEKRDVTELKATVDWPIVEQHLASLVERGAFVDPDAGGTGEATPRPGATGAVTPPPGATTAPKPTPARTSAPARTATPGTTPTPTPRPSATTAATSMELRKAISAGAVTAKGTGDGLQHLDLTVTSKSTSTLRINVAIGTMLDPSAAATQTMVVIDPASVTLAPKATVTVSLDVACAEMRDDQPASDDRFKVRSTQASTVVMKLLRAPDFASQTFRVKQFAIWTLIHNPTAGGYMGLGSTFSVFGSGPSKDELKTIRTLLISAGIDPDDYRAL